MVIAVTSVLLALRPAVFSAEAIPPSSGTYKDTLRKAGEAGKPVMFKFYHRDQIDWKRLEADLDHMPETVKRFVVYVVDAEKNQALVEQYNVREYPTLLFVKPDGSEITRQHGMHTRVEYQQYYLEKVLQDAGPIAKAQKTKKIPSAQKTSAEITAINELKSAQSYLDVRRTNEAVRVWKSVVSKYPGTEAAEMAQERLDGLEEKQGQSR